MQHKYENVKVWHKLTVPNQELNQTANCSVFFSTVCELQRAKKANSRQFNIIRLILTMRCISIKPLFNYN